jgi:hypothetical protein
MRFPPTPRHPWVAAALALLAVAVVTLSGSGGTSARAAATPAALTRLADTQLDPAALYFVSYHGLVNIDSFQRSGILSYAGYQYAAWYSADRSAMVARRRLPAGPWQVVALPHSLGRNDSHNVISLGISPADGRLHVAMDTHASTVYYVKSRAGLVSDPAGRTWSAAEFGAVQRTLDAVELGRVTYPQFIITPRGTLQLSYRTGNSGDGTNELAEYDATGWHRLGRWSASTGAYRQHGRLSTARNMYLHGLDYGPDSRLYASFTWRENSTTTSCDGGALANHDTGLVYSDDQGRTWRNSAGTTVAVTGSSPVSVDSPGIVVDPINADHALMNQESQAIDAHGYPHILVSYVPGRFTQCTTDWAADRVAHGRVFHLYQDATGWHKVEIPVPLDAVGRSRIVFDRTGNAYVVMPYGRVVAAGAASHWTDWRMLYDGAGLDAFGEVVVDLDRLASDGILSVMYQQKSTGTTPSAIRVLDLRLGG